MIALLVQYCMNKGVGVGTGTAEYTYVSLINSFDHITLMTMLIAPTNRGSEENRAQLNQSFTYIITYIIILLSVLSSYTCSFMIV